MTNNIEFFLGLTLILTFVFYSASSFFYFIASTRAKIGKIAFIFCVLGLIANLLVLTLRAILIGRLPLASGSEFLLCFAGITSLLYLFFEIKNQTKKAGGIVMLIAALLVGFVLFFLPGQLFEVTPLLPALKSIWLTSHVLTAVVAYSAFALAAGLALLEIRKSDLPENNDWVYKIVVFGFVMLTLTIVIGAIWAEQAWGTYWSWDPKETWALITWIIYALYLHLYRRKSWEKRNLNILAVVGFILVLFTYFGVNYLLPGLHSYA